MTELDEQKQRIINAQRELQTSAGGVEVIRRRPPAKVVDFPSEVSSDQLLRVAERSLKTSIDLAGEAMAALKTLKENKSSTAR